MERSQTKDRCKILLLMPLFSLDPEPMVDEYLAHPQVVLKATMTNSGQSSVDLAGESTEANTGESTEDVIGASTGSNAGEAPEGHFANSIKVFLRLKQELGAPDINS